MNRGVEHKLERKLGASDVFSIAAGAMISSGLFVLPGLAFVTAGPAVILAYALAAILIIPSMFSQAELATVQTAMDIMMAKNAITSVTATSATANMSSFPTGNALYPDYLRTATTKGTYSCSTTGLVTQVTTGY